MNGPGGDYLDALQGLITGNVGYTLGLVLVILGIFTLAFKRDFAAALILIAGGVLITLSPGVFNSVHNFVADVLATVGGSENTINL